MEAASSPSTSKVIIQCTDPDNILETFESRFSDRTPLRNLHWKSPSRPLRSIPSLNVSLIRKEPVQNGVQSGARRHQIPGLRETPYLKLYLLRCDDKDSYKESARKEIKQWIKENTLEKESKSVLRNQEHHDAYEWMIVHVVLPNTPAASQPKSSKHISLEATESTDSVNSKSKWTGKSSSTIFDKLRADFASSKSSVPRVAQVRITEQGKPSTALSPVEIEDQWQDLIDNIKAAILRSFDTRVSQYEEDIRERENQRTLPGWNFCTFFILKEGLARGFENVGLLVDALAVYSELETGLDMVLKEANEQDDVDGPGALLPYAKALKPLIRKALDDAPQSTTSDANGHYVNFTLQQLLAAEKDDHPFDVEIHDYRDLILKNQVSARDLRIFMFARKIEILLRQAGLQQSSRAGLSSYTDLNMLADLVEMALDFINQAAREYRADLHAAWGGRLSGSERAMQRVVIGNVVATWSWFAVKQTLNRVLPLLNQTILRREDSPEDLLATALNTHPDEIPERSTSSQDRRESSSTHTSPSREIRSQSLPRIVSISKDSLDVPDQRTKPMQRPGTDRLYTWIARLFLLARTIIECLPSTTAWTDQLSNIELPGRQQRSKKLHRHSSYGADSLLSSGPVENQQLCLDSTILSRASSSEQNFSDLYRLLSACACSLLVHVEQDRALNLVLTELAGQAYSGDDKATARQYLSRVLEPVLKEGSAENFSFATALYAECLDGADRPNEYARCLLACLQSHSARQSVDVAQNYLDRLVEIAASVDPLQLPLTTILRIQDVDRSISHAVDHGGFQLSVRCRSRLQVALATDVSFKLYLSAAGEHEPQQICLDGPPALSLLSSDTLLKFASNISTQGWYFVDRLEMQLGQLNFVHDFRQDVDSGTSIRPRHEVPSVMLFPRSDALRIEMMPATTLSLAEPKVLCLTLKAEKTLPSTCSIGLRPASAGLRLNLHDSTSGSSMTVARKDEGTVFMLENVESTTETSIRIPYTLESGSDSSILMKCQISYDTEDGSFVHYTTCKTDVLLPIAVNVQDLHRASHWFSKFFIRTSRLVPVVLWGCTMDEDAGVRIQAGTETQQPFVVFPQQPAIWTARLQQRGEYLKEKLTLNVRYQCLDELIVNKLRHSFEAAFDNSPVQDARSLLSSHLIDTIRSRWTEQDLEVAGLTRELEMWPMKDLDWQAVLCAFDEKTKATVKQGIEKWHSAMETMSIDLENAPIRTLKLRVELPSPPPVVETGIVLKNEVDSKAPVGQPLLCEAEFQVFMDDEMRTRHEHEFSFEVFAPAEMCIVGGRKKGTIQKHEEKSRIQIILFPQKTGALLLPTIDVRCRRRGASGKGREEWVDVPIEVYNKTLSKALQITPNLQSTTIGIVGEEGNQASNGTLINSKSRVVETD